MRSPEVTSGGRVDIVVPVEPTPVSKGGVWM